MRALLALLCAVPSSAVLAAPLRASDWPRFGGPARDFTSPEKGLLRAFPEGGPRELWKVAVGPGYGGAAVRDGEVYVHDWVQDEADVLRVLDLETGEELWSCPYPVRGRLAFPGSRCVPTVEEDLVYTIGGFGHVTCYDRVSREIAWSVDLAETYGAENPGFGWAQQPLVVEDLVMAAPMTAEVGLAAFDRFTGNELWRTEGLGSSHSTPVLLHLLGEDQIVFLSSRFERPSRNPGDFLRREAASEAGGMEYPRGEGILSAFALDGTLRWRTGAYPCFYPIPAPLRLDDRRLFLTAGYRAGSALLELVDGAGGVEAQVRFAVPEGAQVHLPLFAGGHLYLVGNSNENQEQRRFRGTGGLMCVSLEGQVLWRTGEAPNFGRGAALLADGLLILQDGWNGRLRLVEPSPEGFRLLAEADVFGIDDRKDHQMWAPLALSGGRLLMRSQEELRCLDLRAAGGAE